MKKAITLLVLFILFTVSGHASYNIFFMYDYEPLDSNHSCEITIRYDAVDMCRIPVLYSQQQNPKKPIFSSTRLPEVILINFTSEQESVEHMIVYEAEGTLWSTKSYNVINNWGKSEYQLITESITNKHPVELRILIQKQERIQSPSMQHTYFDLIDQSVLALLP